MDRLIVQALADRSRYRLLKGAVPASMVDASTNAVLQWMQVYWNAYPDHESIQVPAFEKLIQLRTQGQDAESVQLLLHLVRQLGEPADSCAVQGVVQTLQELDLSGKSASLIRRFEAGEEVDLAYELNLLSQQTLRCLAHNRGEEYIPPCISTILQTLDDDSGLKFNFLPTLRDNVRGLLPGDLVMFGARVDSGKSSFLMRALADFMQQVEGQTFLFLNNESVSERLWPRHYQALLGMQLTELVQHSRDGTLDQRYLEAARGNRLIMLDIHGAGMAKVEQIVQRWEPKALLIDMPANIKAPQVGGGNKTDSLEAIWQGLRELSAMHGCSTIGTAQVSAEGQNMLFPPMSAIKDSKTASQGAVDLQIMMGNLDNPDAASLRGFSTPKNKLALSGRPSRLQFESVFDAAGCNFSEYE